MKDLVFQVRDIKALLVDDNAVNLMVASNVLMRYGIQVEEADSGAMAVKKCQETEYDFIFMDYLMPGMNGVETIGNIRNQIGKKETVIIGLSANVNQELTEAFEAAGANHVMGKPLELSKLSEALRRYIPEEKIVKETVSKTAGEEGKQQSEPSATGESIRNILLGTEGLNVEKGLTNVMGAIGTYVKVLNVCCTNITEQVDYIKAGYTLMAVSDLKIYYHSLSGILANIGAEKLSEFSKKMEIAARDQDEAYICENEVSYIGQIETFRDKLRQAVNQCKKLMDEDAVENYKPMAEKEYAKKLDQLMEHIRLFEFNEINDLMEEMLVASQGEKKKIMGEAYDYIQQFQYEEAFKQVSILKAAV